MYEGVEMEAVGVQGGVCVELGDGCRSTHTGRIGEWGGKPGILLSNSSRPGGLER